MVRFGVSLANDIPHTNRTDEDTYEDPLIYVLKTDRVRIPLKSIHDGAFPTLGTA